MAAKDIAIPIAVIRDIERICPGAVARDVSLAQISRWQIGGPADLIVRPRSLIEISMLRAYLYRHELTSVFIGATSNLLFGDAGLRAICVQIGTAMSSMSIIGDRVTAQAGVWVPGLARSTMQAGLTGVEHICGIPGTLGGLIYMNGGSRRKGIGSSISIVTSINKKGGRVVRTQGECEFFYRTSTFQSTDEVIVEAQLCLEVAYDRSVIRRQMLDILASRRQKFPRKRPNCGSVFISDPERYKDLGPPGALIERLGLKGVRCGEAQISDHHSNFIVNLGGAKANEVLHLVGLIVGRVLAETGYRLRAEVMYVTPAGKMMPAHEALSISE